MSKPCIVVVGGNPRDAELLRMALDRQGEAYELVALPDGAEALRFLVNRHAGVPEPRPCVILLDVHLPKYDGLDVLTAVRREPNLRHVDIVMLASGAVRRQESVRMQKLDAVFRQKPRHFSEVLDLAGEVMDLCRQHRESRPETSVA
ncbi:MAG TPA: response regulator [Bryobacteraceae bacterium]|nr:response regulator [Bryobacteraceae bacterium]